jgi:hypothetical protein
MAASADRKTPIRHSEGGARRTVYPVKATSQIYKGTMVCLNAGYAVAAADTSGFLCVGVAEENVLGGAADGDKKINVLSGAAFRFAGASIVAADVGKTAYVSDDQTVADAAGNGVVAGFVEELESTDVVWVYIGKVS